MFPFGGLARKILVILVLSLSLGACGNIGANTEDSDVLYSDSFSSSTAGNWKTEKDELGMTAVVEEALVINLNGPNMLQFSTLMEPMFDDFALEVDATLREGGQRTSHGIIFRMQSPSEFYRFDITGAGRYMVERHNADGTWTRFLDDWEFTEAFQQGPGNTNRIGVVAKGPEIKVYANDQLLSTITDTAYTAGNVALDGGTFGQAQLEVAFDNLVVTNP